VTEGFAQSPRGAYLMNGFLDRAARFGRTAADNARTMERSSRGDVPDLGSMKPPVLVINGEFDHSRPRGEKTAALIPGARHRVLKGAGHCCNIEDPAAFDATVIDFLRDKDLLPAT
jgi:pimeloyl-ACP methyl ester carboxylesterase